MTHPGPTLPMASSSAAVCHLLRARMGSPLEGRDMLYPKGHVQPHLTGWSTEVGSAAPHRRGPDFSPNLDC